MKGKLGKDQKVTSKLIQKAGKDHHNCYIPKQSWRKREAKQDASLIKTVLVKNTYMHVWQ